MVPGVGGRGFVSNRIKFSAVSPGSGRVKHGKMTCDKAIWRDNNQPAKCQCSSVVEQRFRKPSVVGSIPTIGSILGCPPIKGFESFGADCQQKCQRQELPTLDLPSCIGFLIWLPGAQDFITDSNVPERDCCVLICP